MARNLREFHAEQLKRWELEPTDVGAKHTTKALRYRRRDQFVWVSNPNRLTDLQIRAELRDIAIRIGEVPPDIPDLD